MAETKSASIAKQGGNPLQVFSYTKDNVTLSADVTYPWLGVPKGFTPLKVGLYSTTLGTGEFTISVGDGDSPTRFITAETSGVQTRTWGVDGDTEATNANIGFRYSTQDTIDVTVSAASNVTVSSITVFVWGYTDNSTSL